MGNGGPNDDPLPGTHPRHRDPRPALAGAAGPQGRGGLRRASARRCRCTSSRPAAASSATSTATSSSTSAPASRSPRSATPPRAWSRRCSARSPTSPTPASWSRPTRSTSQVCEKLAELTPGDHEKRSALFNSGAEAVENAVKVARHHTGRDAIVVVRPRLPRADEPHDGADREEHALQARLRAVRRRDLPRADGLPLPLAGRRRRRAPTRPSTPSSTTVHAQVGEDNCAAVLIEPIQGEGGFIVPPPGWLRRVADWCREHGILFIADEIQTGFARTGDWFACDHEGVVPDLITTAKGMAGGLPLAAVTGRAEVMDSVHVGGLGGTYGGNPVACAAALAAIETMEAEDLPARAREIEAAFRPAPAGDRRAAPRPRRRHPRPRRDAGRRAGQRRPRTYAGRGARRRRAPRLLRAGPGDADLRHLRQRLPLPAAARHRRRPARRGARHLRGGLRRGRQLARWSDGRPEPDRSSTTVPTQLLIGGEWVDASGGATFEVTQPRHRRGADQHRRRARRPTASARSPRPPRPSASGAPPSRASAARSCAAPSSCSPSAPTTSPG